MVDENNAIGGHTPGSPIGGFWIGVQSRRKAIAIGFTDQRLSPHAGSSVFWAWLSGCDWIQRVRAALPHRLPTSNNNLLPVEKVLAFMQGLLGEARKLTHIAYLRRDPVVPEVLGIRRVASQSVLSRFSQGFRSAGANLQCFRPLWRWCVDRLPSREGGYTLDLDSTRLLHGDGHQKGVAVGYTPRGLKPCLNPLLAVPPRERDWWQRLWETILSPWPNCNAVENRPAFGGQIT